MTLETCTYIREILKPTALTPPPLACDAHCHIFGPGAAFAYAPGVTPPPDAGKAAMLAMNEIIGVQRRVIVQTVNHGFDHSALIDVWTTHPETTRGIALARTDISDAELRNLDAHGCRGVRFHLTAHMTSEETHESIRAFTRRLARIGWHIQLHIDAAGLAAAEPMIRSAAVPVVVDHLGYPNASLGVEQPGFQRLLRLMETTPNVWAKVSGAERASRLGPPYRDAWPFARTLVRNFGDRVLWGTDWPHPKVPGGTPDDGMLMDLVAEYAPTAAERQALLADNPARLFWA